MSTDSNLPNPINASALAEKNGNQSPVRVTLSPADIQPTASQILWVVIRNRTNAIGFNRYKEFIDKVMCAGELPNGARVPVTSPMAHLRSMDSYHLVKFATEAFLMQEIGVLDIEQTMRDLHDSKGANAFDALEERRRLGFAATLGDLEDMRKNYYADLLPQHHVLLPYFKLILSQLQELPIKGPNEAPSNCYGLLRSQLTGPLGLELIWSYWHEEGMMVQTINAIAMRFQNRRVGTNGRDPLAELELSPLRPLNNLIWGFLQDEYHRLSVVRRAHEYDHHYGLKLYGKALAGFNSADSRSKFLEAFHRLIHACLVFYKQADDTTVIADGFPVLNALKALHLILSEGQHNQFGDLPWTARVEMLIQAWFLARPEMREFLPGRSMVAYPEPWMERVDAMKRLQGWNDTSVVHFRDLGVFGEQILLGVRYGAWSTVIDRAEAAAFALYYRAEISSYAWALQHVLGIDLATDKVDATMPSVLLQKRLAQRSAH
jgi:hypothetical protein